MTSHADLGLIGLGTMGAALALNIADNDYRVAVFNRTASATHDLITTAGDLANRLIATETLQEFVLAIQCPRTIILMVPAGDIVDAQIVRRQGFRDQWLPKLRESLAHLVGLIMRRAGGDASGAFRVSSV
jgi:6-phosphogluconate dehydrogenase